MSISKLKIIPMFILMIIGLTVKSQVIIGKNNASNNSISLEFAETENRGFILPYITDKSNIAIKGSIIYDITDNKVKYLKDDNSWINLSEDDGTIATIGIVDISTQGTKNEQSMAKVAIGMNSATDTIKGILVLTDADKAMVLPKVASPHLNIINPASGMMVYDTKTKQLAVYNGTVWSFWKP